MIEQGDYYYRKTTREALRQAKMYYVEAKALFKEDQEVVASLTGEFKGDWSAPTLGAVTAENFRPPYNDEMGNIYDRLEERLYNLRHWLAIDGTPLNIPLVAAPIDPRKLQQAAIAGISPSQSQQGTMPTLNYTFDDLFRRAKSYVKDMIYWSRILMRYLYTYEMAFRSLNAGLEQELFDRMLEVQDKKIEIAKKSIELKQLARKEIQVEHNYYIADLVLTSIYDYLLHTLHLTRLTQQSAKIPLILGEAGLQLTPNIFGLVFGGANYSSMVGGSKDILQLGIESNKEITEEYKNIVATARRVAENSMKIAKAEKTLDKIDKEIKIEEDKKLIEDAVKAQIEKHKDNKLKLWEFNQTRFTSKDFYKWYTKVFWISIALCLTRQLVSVC